MLVLSLISSFLFLISGYQPMEWYLYTRWVFHPQLNLSGSTYRQDQLCVSLVILHHYKLTVQISYYMWVYWDVPLLWVKEHQISTPASIDIDYISPMKHRLVCFIGEIETDVPASNLDVSSCKWWLSERSCLDTLPAGEDQDFFLPSCSHLYKPYSCGTRFDWFVLK